MKKYLIHLIFFIIIFIISFIFLFPYNTLSTYLFNKYIFSRYQTFLNYQYINSNIIKTQIKDINIYLNNKSYNLKSIVIDYNPLFLLKKEILIYTDPLKIKLILKKRNHNLLYKGDLDLDSLIYYTRFKTIKGQININGNFNLLNKTGILHLTSNKLVLKNNSLNLKLKHIIGAILINRNRITIQNFSAKGTPTLDITGNIILNFKYVSMSPINIRLKVSYPYMNKYITITGTLYDPQIIY